MPADISAGIKIYLKMPNSMKKKKTVYHLWRKGQCLDNAPGQQRAFNLQDNTVKIFKSTKIEF